MNTKKVALFDFDETLVHENSLSYLFKYLLGRKPLFFYLFALFWDLRVYRGQLRSLIKHRLYKKSLEGRDAEQVYQAGLVSAAKLSQIKEVVQQMYDLHEKGIEVWIITASPQPFIEGIVAQLKWPVARVIGTLLESEKGKLTGEIGPECQLEEKVRRFNITIEEDALDYCVEASYGNLPVDIPMLNLAQHKFFVENGKLDPFVGN